jgi:heat shock protein HspQ
MDDEIKLGDQVKDRITGFEGVVTAMARYMNNTPRAAVKSRELREGRPQSAEWFDLCNLELVTAGVIPVEPAGDMPFKFGDEVKNTLSPFKGRVMGYVVHSTGCIRVGVWPNALNADSGTPVDEQYFPPQELELVKASKAGEGKRTGGPMRTPGEMRDPRA